MGIDQWECEGMGILIVFPHTSSPQCFWTQHRSSLCWHLPDLLTARYVTLRLVDNIRAFVWLTLRRLLWHFV